jgi:glycosyltransferase involved in cell wall biosynthesis
MKHYPRIFIGLRELSGYYHHLKKGFDALGIDSVFVNLSGHPYQYGTDDNPPAINIINKIAQKIGTMFYRNWVTRVIWVVFLQNIISLFLLPWALFRYDVFLFASNSTFFFFIDLPILKLFRKKIIYVFHGSEARPVYLNGYVIKNSKLSSILIGIIAARIQKIMISVIDIFADHIINIPPQAYFHSRPFISWWMIGVPHDVKDVGIVSSSLRKGSPKVVRILHAPSKPEPKGTARIRQVVQSLKQKGHSIVYVEITGRPNSEVLQELAKCDFIVDEIYSDTPMAVFATEAAFAGKPAVVGSYYVNQLKDDLPVSYTPPSFFCHPDLLEAAMEKLIIDHKFREELGKKAREFVITHWSATKVAQHYIMLIDGNFPEEWLYDPRDIRYLRGCGLSEEKAKKIIAAFLKIGGKKSLCLSDKPALEEMFVQFASASGDSRTISL